MHRWYYVKGISGRLVGHPEQREGSRRFVGKQRKDQDVIDTLIKERGGLGLDDLYDDIDEIVKDDASGHVADAIKNGDVEHLAFKYVVAHNHAAAFAALKGSR